MLFQKPFDLKGTFTMSHLFVPFVNPRLSSLYLELYHVLMPFFFCYQTPAFLSFQHCSINLHHNLQKKNTQTQTHSKVISLLFLETSM